METREAHSVEGLPDCDGEVSTYTVGREYYRAVTMDGYNSPQRVKTSPVTKITVEADLPGLHCDMERVKVFDENGLVFEAPVANVGGIHYLTQRNRHVG